VEHNGLWVYSILQVGGGFTRPSVHQRSEALKEPCDGLGVFKRGTQWATIQDFVCSPSEIGSDHLQVIAEEVSPAWQSFALAGYGYDEHGHSIHEHESWQRELSLGVWTAVSVIMVWQELFGRLDRVVETQPLPLSYVPQRVLYR
jgi:hypothetical protein